MIHIFEQSNHPIFLEGLATAFVLLGVAFVSAFILIGIAQLLLKGYVYVTDNTDYLENPLLSFMEKHVEICSDFDEIGNLIALISICLLGIVFYEVAVVGTIIYAMMRLTRTVLRLKSALTKHIDDKKAHK